MRASVVDCPGCHRTVAVNEAFRVWGTPGVKRSRWLHEAASMNRVIRTALAATYTYP
jgi:hypothetical protein